MSGRDGTGALSRAASIRSFLDFGLLFGVGLATALIVVLAPQSPVLALLPVATVAGLWLVVRAPLVASVSVLLAVLLAIDDTGDAIGQWRTPLAFVGDLLHLRIGAVLGVGGLAVTGMEVMAGVILAVWLYRKVTSRRGASARVAPASPLAPILALYVLGVVVSVGVGLSRGLPIAPWKIRNLLHPVLLVLLFLAAYRGPQDDRLVGRIVVFAACARAILAIVVQRVATSLTGGPYAYATSHGDSVLFAVAIFIVFVDFVEQPGRGRFLRAAVVLPVITAGAIANDRRLVWVMIALMLLTAFLVGPKRGWRRSVVRLSIAALPILILYVAVGWNSSSKVFAPVKTFRSVADTSVDRSAYWREVEIWNIAVSMRVNPLLGLGLGGEYTEHMPNDDVSEGFKEYREWPHNTVLGLLMLMGLLPFTAMWALLPLVVFFSMRSYRMARTADERVSAMSCMGTAVACLVLAYGDTGAHFPQFKILLALAVAVSSRLVVATGAWPATRRIA